MGKQKKRTQKNTTTEHWFSSMQKIHTYVQSNKTGLSSDSALLQYKTLRVSSQRTLTLTLRLMF
jgi:hypothetical protein